MSRNTRYRSIADRIRKSALVIPMFFVFFALWIISWQLSAEDFWTSYQGYLGLPTRQGLYYTAWAVAALPQVGQVAAAFFGMAFWQQEGDEIFSYVSWAIWGVLWCIDSYTDVFYRTNVADADMLVWGTAIVQAIIFTLGSELAFAAGFGMVAELFPEMLAESFGVVIKVRARWETIRALLENKPAQPPTKPNEQQQNRPNRTPEHQTTGG